MIAFEDGLEVTRRELRHLVEGFAATLAGRIDPGERVAIAMENRLEYLVAFLAVVANRGVVVPLDPAAGPVDAGHVLRTSGAVLAVVDASGAPHVADRAALPALRETIALDGPEPGGLPAAGDRVRPRRGGVLRPARRPDRGHVHVGHDRPAEGLHDRPRVGAARHGRRAHRARATGPRTGSSTRSSSSTWTRRWR